VAAEAVLKETLPRRLLGVVTATAVAWRSVVAAVIVAASGGYHFLLVAPVWADASQVTPVPEAVVSVV